MSKATYPLKLPLSIKKAAQRLAKEDGVSLNQWIAVAVAEKVGVVENCGRVLQEANRKGNRRRTHEVSLHRSQTRARTGRHNPLGDRPGLRFVGFSSPERTALSQCASDPSKLQDSLLYNAACFQN
jgi:hypothetical protein